MAVKAAGALERIEDLLGEEAESLLTHTCEGVPRDLLHLPGPDHIDAVFGVSDRNPQVLVSLQRIFDSGRLGVTAISRSCPSIRGSSIRVPPPSHRTRSTSIRGTS